MNPSEMSRTSSEVGPEPWLRRTGSVLLFLLFVGACLAGPCIVLLTIGPWAALPAAVLAIVIYCMCRHGESGFGPLWLEMVDVLTVFGNAGIGLFSIVQLVRPLFQ